MNHRLHAAAEPAQQADAATLQALLHACADGVLVCDGRGRRLAWNERAAHLLLGPPGSPSASAEDGRAAPGAESVFALVGTTLLRRALERLRRQRQQGRQEVSWPWTTFCVARHPRKLLRVEVVAAAPGPPEQERFVLFLEPAEPPRSSEGRTARMRAAAPPGPGESPVVQTPRTEAPEEQLHALIERLQPALAGIQAAIETLHEYPSLEASVRTQFQAIVQEQVAHASRYVEAALTDYVAYRKEQWPLYVMLGGDVLRAAQVRIEEALGLRVHLDPAREPERPLLVEAQTLLRGFVFLADLIRNAVHVDTLTGRLVRAGRHTALELAWSGRPVSSERLRNWKRLPLPGGRLPLRLGDVLAHHRAEIAAGVRGGGEAYLRLLLPNQV